MEQSANTNRNVVLIGMPAAGKSTLGVVAAKMMGMDFIDADLLIQRQCDRTLQKILDAMGTDGFIQRENQVLKDIDCKDTVISTGGSAVYSDEAMQHLASIGTVVYLKASLDELEGRLGSLHERGVVMREGMGNSLAALYDERIPLYEKYAEITVDTDGTDTREAVQRLVDALR